MHSIQHNIEVISFNTVVQKASVRTDRDLLMYNLLGKKDQAYESKDAFDIFTHYVFLNLCNECVEALQNGNKGIIVFCNGDELENAPKAFDRVKRLVKQLLPAYSVESDYNNLHDFADDLDLRDVYACSKIEEVNAKIESNQYKQFNLNKLIKYLEKRGMKYLSSVYFQQVNSKLLAANK